MEKSEANLVKSIIALIVVSLLILMIPTTVLGNEAQKLETQMIQTQDGFVVYVNGKTEQFTYALSGSGEVTGLESYTISVPDSEETQNQVAFITNAKYEEIKEQYGDNIYLHVETENGVSSAKLDFENPFTQEMMETVETTTKRISTTLKTELEKMNEVVNGVQTTVTVGGLEIDDFDSKAKYYSVVTPLPKARYSELAETVDLIAEKYNDMTMYSKIEITKKFNDLYNELLPNEQQWGETLKTSTIMQPENAQNGDRYVVYLRKVAKNEENEEIETVDVKVMTSYREDEEEAIPGRIETRVVKETAKLPITGDSIILFVILAVIILVAVIVFVKMKKLQNKTEK